MKKLHFTKLALIGLVCAGAMGLSGANVLAAEKAAGGDAQLTIGRSPRLGSGTVAILVDGKKLGTTNTGAYKGSIPSGKHTLTVVFDPIRSGDKPFNLEINATPGQTLAFIASIQHGDLVLTKAK